MRYSTRRRMDSGFAIALLALVVVSVSSYLNLKDFRQDQETVMRTQEVRRLVGSLITELTEAETHQRGYLLTRLEAFRQPHHPVAPAVEEHLRSLEAMVIDSTARRHLSLLRDRADRRVALLDSMAVLADRGQFDDALEIVRRGDGLLLMSQVRATADSFEAVEAGLLRRRTAAATQSAQRTLWTIVLGGTLAFLVVGVARRRIHIDLAARENAERALKRSEAALRQLYEITTAPEIDDAGRLRAVLRMGREHFGLGTGLLSRVEGNRYVVLEVDSDTYIRAGDVFDLKDTYCGLAITAGKPLSVAHAGRSEWRSEPSYALHGVEAYIGVAVLVGGETYGTLCFYDREPRAEPFTNADEEVLLVFAQWVGADIERRQAQQALYDREERFRGLVETASDLIYSTDRHGLFTYVNPVLQRTTGFSTEELIGTPSLDLIHPDYREAVRNFYTAQIRDGTPTTYHQFPIVTRDGSEIWVGQNYTLLTESGAVVGAQALARDITRQYEIEKSKDEFLSVVSHELRTPLTAIRGSLGLMASGRLGKLEARGQRMLEIAAQNSDRLVRLINDLLDIEKIESGKAPLDRSEIDAEDLVAQAVEIMMPLADRGGLRIVRSIEPVRLDADADRIMQVVTNLLSNAIKFSPPGGTIRVAAAPQGPMVLFCVQDQGRGIRGDKLATIFERFEQADSSDARDKGGTGLGLPIARSIVQQHGGRLWVESQLDHGSTFYFTLPRATPEATTLPTTPAVTPDHTGALILISDDQSSVGPAVRTVLEDQGCPTIAVGSRAEAIRLAGQQRPMAILLDIPMLAADGERTLTALQHDPRTRDVPVIVLSAFAQPATTMDLAQMVSRLVEPAPRAEAADGEGDQDADPSRVNVLIVEDDDDVVSIVREMLEMLGITSRNARSGADAIQLARTIRFDLLLLDLGLPDADGPAVVDWMRQNGRLATTPVLVYMSHDLDDGDRQRLRMGRPESGMKTRASLEPLERHALGMLGTILVGGRHAEADPDR